MSHHNAADSAFAYDVFLSHNSADKPAVEALDVRRAYARALGIWERCLPADHPHIQIARNNLAALD